MNNGPQFNPQFVLDLLKRMKPHHWWLLAFGVAIIFFCTRSSAPEGRWNPSGTGASAIWILANFVYAGMRAQNNPATGWRILAFIFGLPGTLVSLFVVEEGSERAYGVDLPRKQRPWD